MMIIRRPFLFFLFLFGMYALSVNFAFAHDCTYNTHEWKKLDFGQIASFMDVGEGELIPAEKTPTVRVVLRCPTLTSLKNNHYPYLFLSHAVKTFGRQLVRTNISGIMLKFVANGQTLKNSSTSSSGSIFSWDKKHHQFSTILEAYLVRQRSSASGVGSMYESDENSGLVNLMYDGRTIAINTQKKLHLSQTPEGIGFKTNDIAGILMNTCVVEPPENSVINLGFLSISSLKGVGKSYNTGKEFGLQIICEVKPRQESSFQLLSTGRVNTKFQSVDPAPRVANGIAEKGVSVQFFPQDNYRRFFVLDEEDGPIPLNTFVQYKVNDENSMEDGLNWNFFINFDVHVIQTQKVIYTGLLKASVIFELKND